MYIMSPIPARRQWFNIAKEEVVQRNILFRKAYQILVILSGRRVYFVSITSSGQC